MSRRDSETSFGKDAIAFSENMRETKGSGAVEKVA